MTPLRKILLVIVVLGVVSWIGYIGIQRILRPIPIGGRWTGAAGQSQFEVIILERNDGAIWGVGGVIASLIETDAPIQIQGFRSEKQIGLIFKLGGSEWTAELTIEGNDKMSGVLHKPARQSSIIEFNRTR